MKPFHGFSKTIIFELLIVISVLFEHVLSNKFEPTVVLYENLGGKGGSSIKSVAKSYPNLHTVNFDNKAQTACLVGTWIFYGDTNYANYTSGVSAQFRSDGSCFNFQKLGKNISSFRFAGSPKDFRNDVLDLFDGIDFTDVHLRTNVEVPNVAALKFSGGNSVIVHGKSQWTLYEKPEFRGKGLCVAPQSNFVPTFHRNRITLDIEIIQSVRKGCYTTPINEYTTTTERAEAVVDDEGKTQKPTPVIAPTHKPQRPTETPKPNNGTHSQPSCHQ